MKMPMLMRAPPPMLSIEGMQLRWLFERAIKMEKTW
jgi:hypothetical protein